MNTLKCRAVDEVTPLGAWVGEDQFHAEHLQMWITRCTGMWQGIIWNQLSTRVSLATH